MHPMCHIERVVPFLEIDEQIPWQCVCPGSCDKVCGAAVDFGPIQSLDQDIDPVVGHLHGIGGGIAGQFQVGPVKDGCDVAGQQLARFQRNESRTPRA